MTEQSEQQSGTWPNDTPILARLIGRLGSSWPHFRLTEQTDEHGRRFTLIEWGDEDTEFDPTAPNDFLDFVSERPEPPEKDVIDRDG